MPTVDELVKLVCVRVAFARSINKKNIPLECRRTLPFTSARVVRSLLQ